MNCKRICFWICKLERASSVSFTQPFFVSLTSLLESVNGPIATVPSDVKPK